MECQGGVIMWEKASMTLGEAFQFSMMGFAIVFLALIAIALFVKLITGFVGGVAKEETKVVKSTTPTSQAPAANNGLDKAVVAAIIGAVSAEMKQSVDSFRIVSINQK